MTTTSPERSADAHADTIALAAELTNAWLTNPHTRASSADVVAFLTSMHEAVSGLSSPTSATDVTSAVEHVPAVSVRKSLADPNRILSMIDGKPYASLKRHLASHGLKPAEYRARFNLKADYPMVAPGYSERRRSHANQIGLGRKRASAMSSRRWPRRSSAMWRRAAEPRSPPHARPLVYALKLASLWA
jgi:predicted transcriptional regulator